MPNVTERFKQSIKNLLTDMDEDQKAYVAQECSSDMDIEQIKGLLLQWSADKEELLTLVYRVLGEFYE